MAYFRYFIDFCRSTGDCSAVVYFIVVNHCFWFGDVHFWRAQYCDLYFCFRNLYGAGWLLAEGILTILLGLFVLCDQVVTINVIPYIFGLWTVFSGVTRTVDSLEIKRFGVKGWYWMTLVGVASILLGFISFIRPVIAIQIIGITMGLVFLVQGAAALFMWWFESHLKME